MGSDADLDLLNDVLWQTPVLMLSFEPTDKLRQRRGQIFAKSPIPKIEQQHELSVAGTPAPRTSLLGSLSSPSPDEWRALLIVKPANLEATSTGKWLCLIKTQDLAS